jgi:peptidoglycan-N-acetylglucosamine deacetylase
MFVEFAATGLTTGLVAGGYAYAAMWPTSQIFGRTILSGNDPSEIALTFDDGPNDPWTGRLLDILDHHQARATFFFIGRFVRQRPDLVRMVRQAGHLVGNHTQNHPVLLFQKPAKVREELLACNAALEDALGESIRYFRPPHGARRPDVLATARDLGLTPVLWTAMGHDWDASCSECIENRLEKEISADRRRGRGSNVLLHDGGQASIGEDRGRTVMAVDALLSRYQQRTRFVTVDIWS